MIREIGNEAFEYGLLIGNEDFRLVGHEIADILVTFPHRTLQEFLGSYYFVLKLSEGGSLESLLGVDLKKARFMQDQLFLDFCLWFANGNEDLIPISKGKIVLQSLKSYIVDRIDVVQFEPEVIARVFPACDVKHAYEYKRHDSALLTLLKEVISSFRRVQHLMLTHSDPIEYILDSMRENICHLSSIMVEDMNGPSMSMWPSEYESSKSMLGPLTYLQFVEYMHCEGVLDIVLTGKMCTHEMLDKVLQRCSHVEKLVSVYLFISDDKVFELSQFLRAKVKKLFMVGYRCCSVTCQKDIPSCSDLTHLYFVQIHQMFRQNLTGIDSNVLSKLSEASHAAKLPNLTNLCFEHCRFGLESKLHLLSQSSWPSLTYLNLCECYLTLDDFYLLFQGTNTDSFPSLRSLLICDLHKIPMRSVLEDFPSSWPNLESLVLDNIVTETSTYLFKERRLPNLTYLLISPAPNEMQGGLQLLPETIPRLEAFKLSHFRLVLNKFRASLEQQTLQVLDISHCSGFEGNLSCLLSETFPSLNTLRVQNCGLNSQDLRSLSSASVDGRLPELKHLDISRNLTCAGYLGSLFDRGCRWSDLVTLDISQPFITRESSRRACMSEDIEVICSKVESGCLNSLEELGFTAYLFEYPKFEQKRQWLCLKKLRVLLSVDEVDQDEKNLGDKMKPIVKMVQRRIMPSLRVVHLFVNMPVPMNAFMSEEKYKLAKANVCVFISGKHGERKLED